MGWDGMEWNGMALVLLNLFVLINRKATANTMASLGNHPQYDHFCGLKATLWGRPHSFPYLVPPHLLFPVTQQREVCRHSDSPAGRPTSPAGGLGG